MGPYTKATDILSTLHHVNMKYNKLYCWPSQLKLLKLLKQYHHIKMSIATINRWLREVEDEGLIKRTRRSKTDKILGKVFQSTMYEITEKGYHHLHSLGVKVWNIIKNIINREKSVKKKEATGVRINGDGYPLITYKEYLKNI